MIKTQCIAIPTKIRRSFHNYIKPIRRLPINNKYQLIINKYISMGLYIKTAFCQNIKFAISHTIDKKHFC